METVDIDDYRIHRVTDIVEIVLSHILQEKALGIKSGQTVSFIVAEKHGIFGKLNGPVNTCSNKFRQVIRLLNNINSAELQTLYLGFFIAS